MIKNFNDFVIEQEIANIYNDDMTIDEGKLSKLAIASLLALMMGAGQANASTQISNDDEPRVEVVQQSKVNNKKAKKIISQMIEKSQTDENHKKCIKIMNIHGQVGNSKKVVMTITRKTLLETIYSDDYKSLYDMMVQNNVDFENCVIFNLGSQAAVINLK